MMGIRSKWRRIKAALGIAAPKEPEHDAEQGANTSGASDDDAHVQPEAAAAGSTKQNAPTLGRVIRLKEALGGGRARPNINIETPDQFPPRTGNPDLYDRFADFLPWVAYDPETGLFTMDGTKPGQYEGLGFVLELSPQLGASEAMATYLAGITRLPAPTGTGMQVTMFGSPEIDPLLRYVAEGTITADEAQRRQREGLRGAATVDQAVALRSMAERLGEYTLTGSTSELFPQFNYRFRTHRLIMSVSYPASDPEDPKAQKGALTLREQVIAALNQYYLYEATWDADDLLIFAATILNPHRMFANDYPIRSYDNSRELRYQVIDRDTEIQVDEHTATFSARADRADAVAVRAMSVNTYPKAMTMHSMLGLLGDETSDRAQYPGPFLITAGFAFLDYEQQKNKTMIKSARATTNAESQMARFLPQMHEIAQDWRIMQEAFDTGLGSVKMYHQLLLFARPDKIDEAEQVAKSIWRTREFDLVRDRYIQLQGVMGSLPMAFGPLLQRDMGIAQRLSTKTSFNAANLLPLVAEWRGTGARDGQKKPTPQLVLGGRRGQVILLDLFANPSGNFNACVVGKSGSGKSFALNMMVTRTIATGGRVWVFDIGGSYRKLCSRFGGQYVEFRDGHHMSLHPFSMVTDLADDLDMLKGVLARMIKPTETMSDYEMAQLEHHIQRVFQRARSEHEANPFERKNPWPDIDDLAYDLINNPHQDPRLIDMGRSLAPYCRDGNYGRWFQGRANVDFNSNFVVLEMEQLATKPELRAVVLMLLMQLIAVDIYQGRRDQPKMMLIDEAWDLMRSGATSKFIEGLYRKVRKYGGAVVTATQSVGDYFQSETAQAAFDNADWMLLLAQKPESVAQLAQSGKLVLDDALRKQLLSVRRVGEQYSEIMIRGGDMPPTIGRLFADPYSALINTTRASDVQLLDDLQAQGLSLDEAIRNVLKRKGVQVPDRDDAPRYAA